MKEIDNILTHFGDATYQKYIFLATRCVQLDNGVTSPWLQEWEGENVDYYYCRHCVFLFLKNRTQINLKNFESV